MASDKARKQAKDRKKNEKGGACLRDDYIQSGTCQPYVKRGGVEEVVGDDQGQ